MELPSSILLTLGHQVGLLTTVVVALALIRSTAGAVFRLHQQLIAGVLFGGAAILGMLDPIQLAPGIIADARNVIIAAAGPFAGPWAAIVAAALAAGFRWSLGGGGAPAALVGLAGSAIVSVGFASALRRFGREIQARDLLVLATLVSVVNLGSFFLLPGEIISQFFGALALPLVLTNFVGIGILGLILLAERQRRELQQALASREAQYRLLADNATDMIIQSDLDTKRRYVSPASRDLLGYEPEELVGTRPIQGVHPDDVDDLSRVLSSVRAGQTRIGVTRQRHRHKDGRWIWTEACVRLIQDASARTTGYVAAIRDISERVRLEERLLEQARTDVLTGVLNRRGFEERLDQEWARAQRTTAPLALLMLDVDQFKQFNDQFGHGAGDDCLRQVARILRQNQRVSDVVGRLGGEEFGLLLPDTDLQGALAVAQAVRSRLTARQIAHPKSSHRFVTVSIGVAAAPSPVLLTQADLLKASDQAMYRAKHSGRNQVVAAGEVNPDRTAA